MGTIVGVLETQLRARTEQFTRDMKNADGSLKQFGVTGRDAARILQATARGISGSIGFVVASAQSAERSFAALATTVLASFAAGGPIAGAMALVGAGIGTLIGLTNKETEAVKRLAEEQRKQHEARIKQIETQAATLADQAAFRDVFGREGTSAEVALANVRADIEMLSLLSGPGLMQRLERLREEEAKLVRLIQLEALRQRQSIVVPPGPANRFASADPIRGNGMVVPPPPGTIDIGSLPVPRIDIPSMVVPPPPAVLESQWARAEAIVQEEFVEPVVEGLQEVRFFSEAAGDAFTFAFEDAIIGGEKLRDVLRNLANDLARLTFRTFAAPAIGNVFGSLFGSVAGDPFAGSHIPGANAITESGQFGLSFAAQRAGPVTMIINTPDADSFRRSEPQIRSAAQRALGI